MYKSKIKSRWLVMLLAFTVIVAAALPTTYVTAAETTDPAPVELIAKGASWSYSDEGIDYSNAMITPFDFSSWKVGFAPFGYKVSSGVASNNVAPATEFGKVSTLLSFGSDASKKYVTTYFSKIITIDDVSAYGKYNALFGVDDGIVLYVNGNEIYRAGMPETGAVTYSTFATSSKDLPVVYSEDLTTKLKAALTNGANVFTAEIHNQSLSSSDLYFDMQLTATPATTDNGEGSGGNGGTGSEPGNGTGGNNGSLQNVPLLTPGSMWKYLDDGSDQKTAWRETDFNDTSWKTGQAPLGYPTGKSAPGFSTIKQVIEYGPDASKKYRTSYFRTTINVSNTADYSKIAGTFGIDDGVVLYLNGTEVYRYNMSGEPNYQSLSVDTINDPVTETADLTQALSGVLHDGVNVLAAEVHQRSDSSSDLFWDMQLIANPDTSSGGNGGTGGEELSIPTAIALTFNGDPGTSQGFAWYTGPSFTGTKLEVVEASQVEGGVWPISNVMTFEGSYLPIEVYQSSSDKSAGKKTSYADHKAIASGLKPNTSYSYRVGDGDSSHWSQIGTFKTADTSSEPFTFLYTTDPQGTTEAEYVTWNHTLEEAFKKFPSSRFVTVTGDLVDNGDIENQWMWLLNKAQGVLKQTPIVPALGNHESKSNNNFWYHFNLPNISYTGAKPDGSVYSFDYGQAHFMVINTEYNEATNIDTVYKKQEEWLRAEAAKSNQKWKIVLFHKSPYSVANHTSDSDVLFFRSKLTALFDELGIDVVLSGHDHTYTRTYPMYGNEKQSASLDEDGSMVDLKGTLYLVSNAAGDKRYTPKAGPFPFAEKYGQPNKEMFTGITVTDNEMSFQVYTTTETGTTDLYDTFSIKKTDKKPGLVQHAQISAIEDGKATLSWEAPASEEAVTAYRIYEKNGLLDHNWNDRIVPNADETKFTYELTGLDPTASYQFVIKAVSDKTNSDEVIASAADNNGNNGNSGETGNNGGNNGNTGETGNNGGNNGNTGEAGNNGNNGNTGETGNNGNSGNTAETGNSGNSGNNGASKPVFTDISSGHWAKSAIEQAVERGIVTGYTNGTFQPDKRVTRAEFVTMIARALNLTGSGDSHTFADQASIPAWAQDAVTQAASIGLTQGYADGTFRPNQQITRLELIVLIVRASGIELDPSATVSFADADQIPAWARPYVAAAVQAGYAKGVGGNRFAPASIASRAEAAVFIMGMLNKQ